jgi:hypothetical protein
MANIPASVQTDRNSAPVEFGQSREISSKRISRSTLILFISIDMTCKRTSSHEFSKCECDLRHRVS